MTRIRILRRRFLCEQVWGVVYGALNHGKAVNDRAIKLGKISHNKLFLAADYADYR
ncbi:MAG: hypothetical protein ACI9E1_001701 [Cryomorphaceae bacterium]|jgi:hypothetical protein